MIVRNNETRLSLLLAWQGTVLPKVLPALVFVILVSTVLVYLSHSSYWHLPAVPAIGFTIFGVILSIFLSFRNNACYDRWWEGRKLWGHLIATMRHLNRDTHILKPQLREVLLQRALLFNHLLRDRLRVQQLVIQLDPNNLGFSQQEWLALRSQVNPAQWVLEQMQKLLVEEYQQGRMSDIIYQHLTLHLFSLGNIQGGCDRILSTPLPFSYSVLLHRAVYTFCLILPFSLEASLGWWTPILVGLIAYMFLGLEELSAELEEPFGVQNNDLALDTIVRMLEHETFSSLGYSDLPELIQQKNGQLR